MRSWMFRSLLPLPEIAPGFGGAPSPPPVPAIPPAAAPPTMANPTIAAAGAQQRSAAAAAAGMGLDGTIQNTGGASGVTPLPNQQTNRTLLG